ncbi:DUF2326 domain-containing protein [Arthrobacter livingstonensis]|uniref:DUF2326 domain-containing protein n=1 Tax=Arthrobacter livingstonensis TaxID=670078 RepID=A0A2V5LS25_9MICC|nr:DUF2326 domain-containing protein [Arthrobacter livingstonensis]
MVKSMYLKNLRIINTKTMVTLRSVTFNQGANFVVDSETSSRHNKVGKTTFLRLIDIAMGANDRSMLYKDKETNTTNNGLKGIITDQKLCVETVITSAPLHLSRSPHETTLRVDLFPGGQYYINGGSIPQKEYQSFLNNLIFSNSTNVPTFRQLIGAFVRVSLAGDNSALLRYLNSFTRKAEYRSVYSFLLRLEDPELSMKISKLSSDFEKNKEAKSRYVKIIDSQDEEALAQILVALEQKRKDLDFQIADLVDPEEFKANREVFNEVRDSYSRTSDRAARLSYEIDRAIESLRDARIELSERTDLDIVREFFDEMSSLIPTVSHNFEELILFNEKLSQNKIAFLEESIAVLVGELELVNESLVELEASSGDYFAVVASGEVDSYVDKLESLNSVNVRIGSVKESIETLEEFDNRGLTLSEEMEELRSLIREEGALPELQISKFNEIFTAIAQEINGESPILLYSSDVNKFPVGFADIDGSSTGTRKSLMAAYDFAYQLFARAEQIAAPRFVVHDIVENIEGDDFGTIVQLSNDRSIQYVVAVLQEKLDSSGIPKEVQENGTIISLSSKNLLFPGGK